MDANYVCGSFDHIYSNLFDEINFCFFYIKKIIAARLMKMDHSNNSLMQSKRVRFNYIKTFLFPGILPDVSHNFEGVISLKENFFLEFERKFFIQKRNVFK